MFTDWNDTAETFHFLAHGWDVQAAKRLLLKKPREVEEMDIEGLRPFLPKNGFGGVLVDRARVESGEGIDLDVPIILGEVKSSHLPLDGWHRIARALHLGLKTVPCVVLTLRETSSVHL